MVFKSDVMRLFIFPIVASVSLGSDSDLATGSPDSDSEPPPSTDSTSAAAGELEASVLGLSTLSFFSFPSFLSKMSPFSRIRTEW